MSTEGFLSDAENLLGVLGGGYESTIGSAMSFSLGSKYDHVFGSECRLYCDPLDLLFGNAASKPLFTAIMGMTGKTEFAFGSCTDVTYLGRKFEIKRQPVRKKTSEYDFSTPEGAMISLTKAGLSPTDLPIAQTVAVLTILMCAIALVLDLLLHFLYPKFGSDDEEDQAEINTYGLAPKLIKAISVILVSRLMAAIRFVEMKGTRAEIAVADAKDSAADAVAATEALTGEEPATAAAAATVEVGVERSEDAMEEAAGALSPVED